MISMVIIYWLRTAMSWWCPFHHWWSYFQLILTLGIFELSKLLQTESPSAKMCSFHHSSLGYHSDSSAGHTSPGTAPSHRHGSKLSSDGMFSTRGTPLWPIPWQKISVTGNFHLESCDSSRIFQGSTRVWLSDQPFLVRLGWTLGLPEKKKPNHPTFLIVYY